MCKNSTGVNNMDIVAPLQTTQMPITCPFTIDEYVVFLYHSILHAMKMHNVQLWMNLIGIIIEKNCTYSTYFLVSLTQVIKLGKTNLFFRNEHNRDYLSDKRDSK